MGTFSFPKKETHGRRFTDSGPPNPYLNAHRTWNAHEGSILSAKRMWQAIALFCLLIALGAVGGIVHIGLQSKFVPYVVQVDKLGHAMAVAPADRAAPVDERVIHATLAAFIADARMVTPDATLQKNAIFRIYSMLSTHDPATMKMNEWLNGNPDANPFARSAKETVHTEISSVVPQSPETWLIDWREETRDRQGGMKGVMHLRALVTIYFVPPDTDTTIEQLRRNPLGIYVRDFSWSQQIS